MRCADLPDPPERVLAVTTDSLNISRSRRRTSIFWLPFPATPNRTLPLLVLPSEYEWPKMPPGAAMKIVVNDQVHLSQFQASDKEALVGHLNGRDIYDRTLRIPFPYTDADADEWLALVVKITMQQGRPVHWAIRNADDALIGGCGFDGFQVGKSHQGEVGYWLARPYWGKGIMTAVKADCRPLSSPARRQGR